MPHYVRFLKPPRIETGSIKTLVTLTTDLGDSFLAEEVELRSSVLRVDSDNDSLKNDRCNVQCIKQKNFTWTAASRQVLIAIDGLQLDLRRHAVQLHVGPADRGHRLGPDDGFAVSSAIPTVISAWSPPFGGPESPQADKLALRWLRTRCPAEVRIWEETGNNLARHIWDASLAWLMLFQETLAPVVVAADGDDGQATSPFLMFKDLIRQNNNKSHFNVIELGAGCGIVGIALAQSLTDCSVLLTDLEEVRDIVSRNINMSNPAAGSKIDFQVLDWETSIPSRVSEQQYDLIVVSDCTYNADSLPALVDTMAALVERSPQAAIIVALKRRHESEAVFFELMHRARLDVCSKTRIQLPSVCSDERVDIEIYCFRSSPSSLR
ncbi:S-adenosyl-L-methionine-dependent methyltransferase [Trichophyton rubrum]|nr:S-adenosyl-L-methionine-dependent methyltransferase [Trichophyton rubrum]